MSLEKTRNGRTVIPVSLFLLLLAGFIYWFGESWLRHFLLYLSTAAWARRTVSGLPLARTVARRFVAGETIDEAITVVKNLNDRGMLVTMDYLGESVSEISEAQDARDEIMRLLDRIDEAGVNATVSVKLSQLGLKLDPAEAYVNVRTLVAKARERNNHIRIDMEESAVVDQTLDIYRQLRIGDEFDNVGIVVQSYLYRTEEDVEALINEGASVRLCKGAYMEPAHVAFPAKEDTDKSFVRLMEMMLSDEALENGVYLGVATHDEKMVEASKKYAQERGIAPERYEFQMLYGIRRDLQDSLVDQGYRVRIYVPYGTAWYPYFVRRLAERPANLWFFLSNLMRK